MLKRVKISKLYLQVKLKDLSVVTPEEQFAVAPKDTMEMAEYTFVCHAQNLFAVTPKNSCAGYVKDRFEGGISGYTFGRAIRFRSPAPSRTCYPFCNLGESS